ncbi:MAG: L-threonylcarbamoyladenylate synthase [Anaerolineales bacterium]|jgi:L-threonylcarbamoyladenylate synthase
MKTIILPVEDPHALPRALETLQSGGLVAFPTDTVYGVGALAFDRLAVVSIYKAKNRPVERAIPVLIGDVDDLQKVAIEIPKIAFRLAAHFWPGPLTLVIPKHPKLPESISAGPTVGVRIPNHPVTLALLRLAGPMAVTSANLSGQPSPKTAQEVDAQLGGRIALILDAGTTPGGVPSTVVDCSGGEPQILRVGPISQTDILAIIESEA